jgi:hypothetical protein
MYFLRRYYVGLGLSSAVLLILVCFSLGVFYGMCGKRPGGLYGDECCNKVHTSIHQSYRWLLLFYLHYTVRCLLHMHYSVCLTVQCHE